MTCADSEREGGRFASDLGRGDWCLAPIRGRFGGGLLAILAGAIGAWHRFEGGSGAIC